MPYYPNSLEVTGIDMTHGMLDRSKKRAKELGSALHLGLGDVQYLDFADRTFEDIVATFVFCSIPNPILGLQEVRRVLKPGRILLLLEHVRSEQTVIGRIMDMLNQMVVGMMGANINRRTVDNVRRSGLEIFVVKELFGGGIFEHIVARRPR